MKFDYGQGVLYNPTTESGTTKPASVVGITPVETDKQVENFGYPRGTVLYLIEFGDGTDKLVPESDLIAM